MITMPDIPGSSLVDRVSNSVAMYRELSTAIFMSSWEHEMVESSVKYHPVPIHPSTIHMYPSPVMFCL